MMMRVGAVVSSKYHSTRCAYKYNVDMYDLRRCTERDNRESIPRRRRWAMIEPTTMGYYNTTECMANIGVLSCIRHDMKLILVIIILYGSSFLLLIFG